MIFGYLWFLWIILIIGYIGGKKLALSSAIGLLGLIVALKKGYFRDISTENITLFDYLGNKRGIIGPNTPSPDHVIGKDWDPSHSIDFFFVTVLKVHH